MDLQKLHDTLTKDYVHKLADWKDAAIYAYIEKQFQAIEEKGLNPTDFQLVEIHGNMHTDENGGLKIINTYEIRKNQ